METQSWRRSGEKTRSKATLRNVPKGINPGLGLGDANDPDKVGWRALGFGMVKVTD